MHPEEFAQYFYFQAWCHAHNHAPIPTVLAGLDLSRNLYQSIVRAGQRHCAGLVRAMLQFMPSLK
ncbi:MAG: hypothetical protein EA393_01835 [Bacteroidetes bacterium]|nr:MAG: hypothetical protein EA393_01835 [Bacteroidota bacterium]